jgi:hypothetical protein
MQSLFWTLHWFLCWIIINKDLLLHARRNYMSLYSLYSHRIEKYFKRKLCLLITSVLHAV